MTWLDRRQFLKISVTGASSFILPFKSVYPFSFLTQPVKRILPFNKIKVLSAKEFYVQSINEKPPKIDAGKWQHALEGLFKNPLILNYNAVTKRDAFTQMTSLACIGNEVGGQQIGNAVWTGCRLKDLLWEGGLSERARKIIFYCEDIYSTAMDVPSLMADNVMLAYRMNDKPLTPEHGFPVRLILPGRYGMKNPKWIKKLVATEEDL